MLEFSPNHADILDRIWTSVQIDWETPTETRRLSRRSLASKFQIAAYDLDFLMASLIRDFFNNIGGIFAVRATFALGRGFELPKARPIDRWSWPCTPNPTPKMRGRLCGTGTDNAGRKAT